MKRIVNTPSTKQSGGYNIWVNPKPFSHLSKAGSYAVNRDDSVVSAISILLFLCLPLAIVWIIIPVIVFSANGQSIWGFPHIGNEVLKTLPAWANGNTPSSVVGVRDVGPVCATPPHSAPYSVSTVGSVSCSMAVRDGMSSIFLKETAARLSMSPSEIAIENKCVGSAITQTDGFDCPLSNNFKPSKLLTDDGYSFRHNNGCLLTVTASGERRHHPTSLRLL